MTENGNAVRPDKGDSCPLIKGNFQLIQALRREILQFSSRGPIPQFDLFDSQLNRGYKSNPGVDNEFSERCHHSIQVRPFGTWG